MNLRPEEISAVIKEQIKNYKNQINVSYYTKIDIMFVDTEFVKSYNINKLSCSIYRCFNNCLMKHYKLMIL